MAEFIVLGQVVHVAPQEFLVLASAVPSDGGDDAAILEAEASSLQAAQDLVGRLTAALRKQLEERGDKVVDVLA